MATMDAFERAVARSTHVADRTTLTSSTSWFFFGDLFLTLAIWVFAIMANDGIVAQSVPEARVTLLGSAYKRWISPKSGRDGSKRCNGGICRHGVLPKNRIFFYSE